MNIDEKNTKELSQDDEEKVSGGMPYFPPTPEGQREREKHLMRLDKANKKRLKQLGIKKFDSHHLPLVGAKLPDKKDD